MAFPYLLRIRGPMAVSTEIVPCLSRLLPAIQQPAGECDEFGVAHGQTLSRPCCPARLPQSSRFPLADELSHIFRRQTKNDLPAVLPAPTIAAMNTAPELREQLIESREHTRGIEDRLELMAEVITV